MRHIQICLWIALKIWSYNFQVMYQGTKVQGPGPSLQVLMLDSKAFPAGPSWGKNLRNGSWNKSWVGYFDQGELAPKLVPWPFIARPSLVDRLVSEHLRTQRRLIPYTVFLCFCEAQRTFVALHLVLPTSQKLLDSVKEWRSHGVFGVRGLNVWWWVNLNRLR
jgi:hypothetical protein